MDLARHKLFRLRRRDGGIGGGQIRLHAPSLELIALFHRLGQCSARSLNLSSGDRQILITRTCFQQVKLSSDLLQRSLCLPHGCSRISIVQPQWNITRGYQVAFSDQDLGDLAIDCGASGCPRRRHEFAGHGYAGCEVVL